MSKKSSPKKGTPPPSQHSHTKSKAPALTVVNPRAAGIDVGATSHYVAVPPDSVAAGESAVRKFGAFTPDLDQLKRLRSSSSEASKRNWTDKSCICMIYSSCSAHPGDVCAPQAKRIRCRQRAEPIFAVLQKNGTHPPLTPPRRGAPQFDR